MLDMLVEDLFNAGADAQSNLFYAEFSLPASVTSALNKGRQGQGSADTVAEETKRLTVRLDGFTPPEIKQDSYTNYYGTAWVDVPKAFADVTRSFPMKFRIDNNYSLYKTLVAVKSFASDPSVAQASNMPPFFTVTIMTAKGDIDALTKTEDLKFEKIYEFEKCWIKKLSAPEYKTGDAGPLTVEATVAFIGMHDFHDANTIDLK